jgi:hypothetical protein
MKSQEESQHIKESELRRDKDACGGKERVDLIAVTKRHTSVLVAISKEADTLPC